MVNLFIGFRIKDKLKIEKVAKDIALQDETFKYKIIYCKDRSKADYILKVYHHSQTKEIAHKRGTWFIKKANVGEFYWVK